MTLAATASNGGTKARPGFWRRLWNSPWPVLGCEISAGAVSAARWSWNTASFEAAAWKPIPAGAVEASPLRENIREPDRVREALGDALASIGFSAASDSSWHPADAVLVIPDQAARLFVFSLDVLPKRSSDALSLVQFRLKKSVPFDIESAAVSYQAARRGGQWEVIAVAAPQPVVRQYEALLESFGLRPRCVVLSTVATLGLIPEAGAHFAASSPSAASAGLPGVLVAKYSPPWFTTAILQGGQLCLFRTVGLPAGPDGSLPAETVLEALYPSMVFFQDNFGGKLERAWLCGLGDTRPPVTELLGQELAADAVPLSSSGTLAAAAPDPLRRELCFSALLGVVEEHSRS
jgi:type IV pilus assembly protein PilM